MRSWHFRPDFFCGISSQSEEEEQKMQAQDQNSSYVLSGGEEHLLKHVVVPKLRSPPPQSCLRPMKNNDFGADKKKKPSKEHSVSFGNLTVRELKITLGDHPWLDGPPVALSWEQVATATHSLDDFERIRDGERRTQDNLWMPGAERRDLLKDCGGFSERELVRAKRIRTHLSRRLPKLHKRTLY